MGLLNAAMLLLMTLAFMTRHAIGPIVYWACVISVTVTVPILGAKIPHLLPEQWPRLVRALRPWTTRLTPAASSLLFHELHHRQPKIPAVLLAEHAKILETTKPSNCEERLRRTGTT